MDHMTALVSAFARAYHYRNNEVHVFPDTLAEKMLTQEEYAGISRNMSDGIAYFAPSFTGTKEEALRFIVDHQLAPSVLARSAFSECAIKDACEGGCRQVVLFACGYDTFSLRTDNPELSVFELDRPEMIADKQGRIAHNGLQSLCHTEYIGCDLSGTSWQQELQAAGFRQEKKAFGSLLGISYYLTEEEFRNLIGSISPIWSRGSFICFDYPLEKDGAESRRNRELAASAGEHMKAGYTYEKLEALLSETGYRIEKHLNAEEMTKSFFMEYNNKNKDHQMAAPEGVAYCLAVKE